MQREPIHVVGGGLAGSEAAWQIANAGGARRAARDAARARHRRPQDRRLAELVCSNSFRSDDDQSNAVGQLHWEMRRLKLADHGQGRRPSGAGRRRAGGGRDGFSAAVTAALEAHPLVTIDRAEVAGLPPPDGTNVIIATGPLTSPALAEAIRG